MCCMSSISNLKDYPMMNKPKKLTLDEFFPIWIAEKSVSVRISTLYRNNSLYKNHISPVLGRFKLEDIKRQDVITLQAYIYRNLASSSTNAVISMMASGVFALLILWELRKMFRTVIAEDCFRRENVVSLSRMGWYSFAIAGLYCIRIFTVPTPSAFVIIIVFVIAGLFSKVLSRVFDQAVTYKIENDLTI